MSYSFNNQCGGCSKKDNCKDFDSIQSGINKCYENYNTHLGCGIISLLCFNHSGNKKLNFSQALEYLKQGRGMRLSHWSADVVVRIQYPDTNSKMTAPYLFVESRFGKVPWKETFIELFSNEWEIVE